MTSIRTLLPSLAVLATLAAPASVHADDEWQSKIDCEQRESCLENDFSAAFRIGLDLGVRHTQDPGSFEPREEVRAAHEFFWMIPLTQAVGVMMQQRLESTDREFYTLLGPSFLLMDGVALGIGPGFTSTGAPDGRVALMAAGNLYVRHSMWRLDGDLGGNADDHRLAANGTFWPVHFLGLGLMVQDDTVAPETSLVGPRLETEVSFINAYVALTGGLRGEESAGVMMGLRLVPPRE